MHNRLLVTGRPALLILLEHPLSSYVQKVKIALREKGVSFTTEIPHELGSGRAGGAFKAANPRIEVPVLDAQLPGHVDLRPSGWRENVGVGIEDKMILLAERLHIVLHHRAAADRLNVDRHPPAVRRRRKAGRDVGR
jgi:hypothetical protein